MKLYPFAQRPVYRVLLTLFFLTLIICCRDTLLALNVIGFVKSQVITAAVLAAAGILFLYHNRRDLKQILKDPRVGLSALAAALLLFPMLAKQDWQLMYLSILFYILAGIFISYFLDLQQASRYYVVLFSALGLYSVLCTYFLRILPDRGLLSLPTFSNPKGYEFYNFGLAQVSIEFVKKRNFGLFREPGVYQFFLLLGLYLNNYRANWEKNSETWIFNAILALTMFSTFSTAGVIEMVLLAVFLFFDQKWYQNRGARILACVLILLGAAAAAYIVLSRSSLYEEFIGMITKFSSEESGLSRFHVIAVDLGIFLHHPILGDTLQNVMSAVESNASSTMVMYAFMGFLTASFHVIAWAALTWDRQRGIISNLILMLILFMSFNTQNLSWDILFWLFPMLGLTQRGLPLLLSRNKKA